MRRLAISGAVILPSLIAAVAMADAPLRLNEIRIEQPGADFDEYIEIAGAPGESLAGVSIVVLGDDDFALPGAQNGSIESVVNLSGAVAASGFFVVAEDTFSLGVANLVAPLNLEGGDNLTVLLVRGFTGFEGQKLDTNDDGTLDITPWTSVVSSVAILATATPNGVKTDYYYSSNTVGPDAGAQPAAAWLCANTAQWNVGSVDPFGGVDTPGAANATCVPTGTIINEIRIDQTGADNDEYFELKGSAGANLGDLTYIVLGDGTAVQGSGFIETVVSLAGKTIPGDGLFVVGESTMLLGVPDFIPTGANPLNFENSDNITHLLVRGFTGAINTDLDTNDDGVLDITPWTEIVDSVALVATVQPPPAGAEWVYSATRVGPDGTFVPGHVFRCTPAATWQIGPFDPPVGKDTIGAENAVCTTCGNGAGNCHAVHPTPGCVDATCCNAVCAIDPTCCVDGWDQACVDQARLSCLAAGPAPAAVINEIRIDEPTATDPNEYIEIKGAPGTPLTGVSLVIVGDGADLDGSVEAVVSLNGLVIPKDGLLLIAESTFTLGTADAVRALNFENGDSVTYFLVFNFLGLNNTDYDLDNDCVLDSQPWDAVLDSIAVVAGDNRCTYSTAVVGPSYAGQPAHVVRCLDDTLRFGRFDPADPTGFGTPGTANAVCPPPYACGDTGAPSCYTVHATPGCSDGACCDAVCRIDVTCCEIEWDQACADLANLNCFVPGQAPDVEISEIRIDQNSFDTDEYFEIRGAAGTLLNGLTYIVLGDGSATQGSGVVEFAQSLQGKTIPANGFFLAARSTLTLNGAVPNLVLPATPEFENSDNMTHMLVFGFTGSIGQDLDTNDDGTLDVMPWATMVQSVAFIENNSTPPVGTEYAYGDVRVGPDPNGFVPSQIAYCPTTNAWTIGPFDFVVTPGFDTPGAPNGGCDYTGPAPCPADLDGSRVVDAADLAALLGAWGGTGPADINNDGSVDAADLAALLGAWGACP